MPASILDPIKEYADDHAEPLSAIVSEALAAYLAREIRRECPRCGAGNSEDSDYCKSCGRALTREAEARALEVRKDLMIRLLDDPDLYTRIREVYLLEEAGGEASRTIAPEIRQPLSPNQIRHNPPVGSVSRGWLHGPAGVASILSLP